MLRYSKLINNYLQSIKDFMKTNFNTQVSNKLLAIFLTIILVAQALYLVQANTFQVKEAFNTFIASLVAIALLYLAVSIVNFYKDVGMKLDKAFEEFKNGGF